jgi:hypothetical protein
MRSSAVWSALSSFGSDVGLRTGLLVAFGLKVSAQRRLAARVGARFELLRHVLQHLDVGRDTLRLDRTSGRGEVARGCQPQRAIAGAERNDGLHRAFAERARADDGRAPMILERAGQCRYRKDTSQPRVVVDPGMRRSLLPRNREISIAVPTSRGRDRVGKAGGRSRR